MRSPDMVFKQLQQHATDETYRYERLYRNFYNEELYLTAARNLNAPGSLLAQGETGVTFTRTGKRRVEGLIGSLRDHRYHPHSVKREVSRRGKQEKQPLEDRLVEEVLRMLLESIYEPGFAQCSHGFRPGRNCHTALLQVRHRFTGVKWFVEWRLSDKTPVLDHQVLVGILRRRIRDEAFLGLIWKFLKAGYLEQWETGRTYSGTPYGRGLAPLLANLYWNELDRFVEQYRESFDRGTGRKRNPAYTRMQSRYQRYRNKTKKEWYSYSEEERREILRTQKAQKQEFQGIPMGDPMDQGYRRIQYVRYVNRFLIGVIGSKADAEALAEEIKRFCRETLHQELPDTALRIRNGKEKARFLGYEVTVCRDPALKKAKGKGTVRAYTGKVKLSLPKEAWVGELNRFGVLRIVSRVGEPEAWKPIQHNPSIFLPVPAMVQRYNARIRGIYDYYRLASNVSVLNKFSYVMEYSLYKTVAAKYRITMTQAKKKYTRDRVFRAPDRDGKDAVFYNGGFRKQDTAKQGNVDLLPEFRSPIRG